MKKLLFLLFILLSQLFGLAQDQRLLYIWNTSSLSFPLASDNSLTFATKTHYRVNDHFREMTYADFKGMHKVNDWFSLGVAFRIAQYPSVGEDDYEYRPQLVTGFRQKWNNIKFRSTLRLEQRWFKFKEDHQRIYHNFFIDFPQLQSKFLKPVVGEELFFKLNDDALHLARIYAGMGVYSAAHWAVDLFYVWQSSQKTDYWQKSDVVALNLKFKI